MQATVSSKLKASRQPPCLGAPGKHCLIAASVNARDLPLIHRAVESFMSKARNAAQ